MIEKVLHKNRLFALIVRGKFRKKSGINFFTQKKATQQLNINYDPAELIEWKKKLRRDLESVLKILE